MTTELDKDHRAATNDVVREIRKLDYLVPGGVLTVAAEGGASGGGDGFANVLGNALDSLSSTQANADNLATQAATGGLTNVADYMVAANEANIQTQLTSAVRNSALQSFQEIMGMQL